MSIAPPRESSLPPNRRPVPRINTPNTSARPSIDHSRSATNSPRLSSIPHRTQSVSPNRAQAQQPRRNRDALRNYYNIKKAEEAKSKEDDTSSEFSVNDHALSDVVESELDGENFDADAFVQNALVNQGLGELLKTYGSILSDIRALDAEKKALVYDNYSKLITATETIHKMRANMDPLNPMASTLDPAIAAIYTKASAIKSDLRQSLPPNLRQEAEMDDEERSKAEKKRRQKEAVRRVLKTPERLREMVREGRVEEARECWLPVLRILEGWKSKGQGGSEVQDCIDDGEAALRGEPAGEKS